MKQEERSQSFEQSMERLEQIVKCLEAGDADLAEALRLFEEGAGLVRSCTKALDEAELAVVQLMKGPEGAPVETEFEDDGIS